MEANLKSSVTIEEENSHCYHIEAESRAVDPRDPTHPIVRRRVICLRPIDYKKYFMCSTEDQIGYLKAMGLENVELVHDPSIEKSVPVIPKKTAEVLKKETEMLTPKSGLTRKKVK